MGFLQGFGWMELVIVLVIIMTVFGVGRLPEVGGAMGKAIREFRSSVSGKTDEAISSRSDADVESPKKP